MKKVSCPFCETDPKLEIAETENMKLIANLYPYGSGHCLIIPKKHHTNFAQLSKEELEEKDELIKKAISAFKEVFDTDSFNFGYNEGDHAGGSLPHFHIHVMPRFDSVENYLNLIDAKITATSPVDCTERMKEALS